METSSIPAAIFIPNLLVVYTIHDPYPRSLPPPPQHGDLDRNVEIFKQGLKTPTYQCHTSKSHFFTNMVAKHKKVQKGLPLLGLKLGSLWWVFGSLLMQHSIAE